MRECRTYGSLRGARSNARPYRDLHQELASRLATQFGGELLIGNHVGNLKRFQRRLRRTRQKSVDGTVALAEHRRLRCEAQDPRPRSSPRASRMVKRLAPNIRPSANSGGRCAPTGYSPRPIASVRASAMRRNKGFAKAAASGADGAVLDLEDGVGLPAKQAARAAAVAFFAAPVS